MTMNAQSMQRLRSWSIGSGEMIDSGFKRKSLARNYARTMTAEPVETTGRRRLTQDPPRVPPGEDPGSKTSNLYHCITDGQRWTSDR